MDDGVPAQGPTSQRVGDGSAAEGKDRFLAFQQRSDRLSLERPEARFSILGEYRRNWAPFGSFDRLIGIDEGQTEITGKDPAHRRLAGPHEADKDDHRGRLPSVRSTYRFTVSSRSPIVSPPN